MARELGAAVPLAAFAAQLESGLVARGYGDEDMSNLARAIRSLSALD
jgi:3-hydroxyisobutyrate dehydrogenase